MRSKFLGIARQLIDLVELLVPAHEVQADLHGFPLIITLDANDSSIKPAARLPTARVDLRGNLASASRGAAAPSRHRRDSCPPGEVVGGFFSDFGAIRTEVSDSDAPRRRHAFHGGQGRAWGGRKQQGDRPHHRRQDRGPRQHHREEAPPPPAERDWGALRRK